MAEDTTTAVAEPETTDTAPIEDTGNATTDTTEAQSSWRDGLPDDLKAAHAIQDIPDVSTLAKNFIETKAMVGANTVKVPGRNAEPAELDAFYKAAGRPDKPEDYQLPTEGLPEGISLSDDDQAALRQLMHQNGANDLQAAGIYRGYLDIVAQATQKQRDAIQETERKHAEAIEAEYGAALPERKALAQQLVDELDNEAGDFNKLLYNTQLADGTFLGNHPVMFNVLARFSKRLKQDKILGDGSTESVGHSVTEAEAQIEALNNDKAFMEAYHDKGHPNHQANKDRMTRLFKIAYGQKTA